jgi:hypothetical protein
MQKLKISRLWILIIVLPGISNALSANCDFPAGKARPNDRRFVPIAFRIWRSTKTNVPAEMLAHFVAEVLGLRAPARSRSESNVRCKLCHETAKSTECSKAAGAFHDHDLAF